MGTIVMCLRDRSIFSVPIHENTDFAANSILVNQAVHFDLLFGNYSREGFHHPGPAYLYLQSFGQDLFYSALHAVPSQYNGQLIAVFILGSTMLALTARTLTRHVGSWTIALAALIAILAMTGSTLSVSPTPGGGWASAWMPFLYVAPFLLATVAGVSVAVGALDDLPLFALAAGLLIHGHIAFVGIMGIYSLVVVIAWLVLQRGAGGYRRQLAHARRALIITAVIVVLFALPIVVNLALHWPGQFGLYWHYIKANPHKNPHTAGQVFAYIEQYWPGHAAGRIVVLGAGAVAVGFALTEPDKGRRRYFLGLIVAVVVITLEVALYALRGVDQLNYVYTGYFYYTTPPLLVAVLVMASGCRLRAWAATSMDPPVRRAAATVLCTFVVFAGVALAFLVPSFENTYRGDANLPRMATAVAASPQRHGRDVAIVTGDPGTTSADWSDVVGLLIAASRVGYQPCVVSPKWTFMMTNQYICTPREARNRWRIGVFQAGTPHVAGRSIVFKDPSTVVYGN